MLKRILLVITCLMALSNTAVGKEQLIVPPIRVQELSLKLQFKTFPKAIDIVSIARVESAFKPGARNKESNGIMQVNGGSFEVSKNMIQGTRILREYYLRLGSEKAAVMAYNIGIGNYKRGRFLINGDQYYSKFIQRRSNYVAYFKASNITRYNFGGRTLCSNLEYRPPRSSLLSNYWEARIRI